MLFDYSLAALVTACASPAKTSETVEDVLEAFGVDVTATPRVIQCGDTTTMRK